MISDSMKWKANGRSRVYLQNFVVLKIRNFLLISKVHEVFGSSRLLLLTTLLFIIKNDEKNSFQVFDKIPERFWHTISYWFVELKYLFRFILLL